MRAAGVDPYPARTPARVTVDEVRDRFGTASLIRAVLLGRSRGSTVPLLPD
jgi:hypothetical protein